VVHEFKDDKKGSVTWWGVIAVLSGQLCSRPPSLKSCVMRAMK
jgi:hypothetical protein